MSRKNMKPHQPLSPHLYGDRIEAGCDEAGRGCLAGPVFAAAVILPDDFSHPLLNDSKKMSCKARNELRPIIENEAIAWAVHKLSPKEIDRYNILRASFKAMHRAIKRLNIKPGLLVIDGHIFDSYKGIDHRCVVKGDAKYAHVAAASILAKTHRDEYMQKLHNLYPQYDWYNNKGYPTKTHRAAIEKYGSCDIHRKSFRLSANQKTLF